MRATLAVRRNPDAAAETTIRLNGDGIAARSVTVDGRESNAWRMDGADLLIDLAGDAHEIAIETALNPAANSQLMGLYASGGMLCTQCEAEGFRRIAFFPDRPDVLSVYRVRMRGDKAAFPVLLSNGNCTARGEGEDGTHWAEWHDPWPKPAYLFALVAGQLVANTATFTTCSGRKVDLAIWVRPGDEARTHHAMDSLIASMKWDEEAFGREYDLDLYNVVAVSDFNMGAMENKGLNVFNTRYVLADPETATDADYDGIEGVIGHEYFHNWSGNRVTCRDWFQLSLKEGFTVLRDQLFSADMGSAAVKRIEDVRVLRSAQFPEDSGPLAHPIRPDAFQEISNFYTATVYNKGAEVIRMMRTLADFGAGPERFRKGTDLYFARHDGEAATCEDFITAIEDGAGLDLTQFRRWYSQAGTPQVTARLTHAGDVAELTLEQRVPPTPGQPDKLPVPIPLRLALFDRASGTHSGEQLVVLDKASDTLRFPGFAAPPVLSINRGFSAPVAIDAGASAADLVFLAAHDDDPFARYEAMQGLVVRHLVDAVSGGMLCDAERQSGREAIGSALGAVIDDPALDDLMRGELMILPAEAYLAEQLATADPGAIHEEREGLKAWLGRTLGDKLAALHDRVSAVPYSRDAEARGARKLKTQALVYLAAGSPQEAARRAAAQYARADNMTDRQGALMVLCGLDHPERQVALADFHERHAGNALVIDKWFSLQAGSLHPKVLEHVKALAEHPEFHHGQPQPGARAVDVDGGQPQGVPRCQRRGLPADRRPDPRARSGQRADRGAVRAAAGALAANRAEALGLMRAELERIAACPSLSRDTREQVGKSLG